MPLDRATDDGRRQIGAALAARGPGLLLLDNVEQLMPELIELLDTWRAAAPDACWLLTTRDRTGLAEADVLDLPALAADAGRALFRDRALALGVALDPHWDPHIDALITDVEGSPLAIELVAARTPILSPSTLRERLAEVLAAFGGRGRHGSLRATVEWSWRLLHPRERAVLAQVAVFTDGFTLELAERVVRIDGSLMQVLDALRQQSLLEGRSAQAAPRAGRLRLPVTVRELAWEHGAVVPGIMERFLDAMRDLAREAMPLLYRHSLPLWRSLRSEERNLAEAVRCDPSSARAAETATGLGMLLVMDGRHDDAAALATHCLDRSDVPEPSRDRLIAVLADAQRMANSDTESEARIREAAQRAADRGEARLADLLRLQAARRRISRSEYDKAATELSAIRENARARGDVPVEALSANEIGHCAFLGGDRTGARGLLEDSLSRCTADAEHESEANLLDTLAYLASMQGDTAAALEHHARAIELADRFCTPLRALNIRQNLALGLMAAGRFEQAHSLQTEVLLQLEAIGFRDRLTHHHTNRAHTRMHLGDLAGAQADLLLATGHARSGEQRLMVDLNRVTLLCLQGRYDEADARASRCLDAMPEAALVMRVDLWIWQALAKVGRHDLAAARSLVVRIDAAPTEHVPGPVLEPVAAVRALLAEDAQALAALQASGSPAVSLAARAALGALTQTG